MLEAEPLLSKLTDGLKTVEFVRVKLALLVDGNRIEGASNGAVILLDNSVSLVPVFRDLLTSRFIFGGQVLSDSGKLGIGKRAGGADGSKLHGHVNTSLK